MRIQLRFDNLTKLYDIRNYIHFQEKPKHNKFNNEKRAIKYFMSTKLLI